MNIEAGIPGKQKQMEEFQDESTGSSASEGASFEAAVTATGFGRFNILLMICAMPFVLCSEIDTGTMSFILPAAECDLELSLANKGMLNAITYIGMISSAILWGYLADTLGRRQLLFYGFLIDGICNLILSLSQSMWMLMFFKFASGFIICGPFAIMMAYLSEFHSMRYRSYIIMICGIYFAVANIIMPSLAWPIIPQNWTVVVSENFILHSWQFFLTFCSLPSLISTLLIWMLPESPKFLMSRGRNIEAVAVFKKVFHLNSGKCEEDYPIKCLIDETLVDGLKEEKAKGLQAFRQGVKQMTPMFKQPLLFNGVLIHTVQFLSLLGLNTLRLWLPQLFTIIVEYSNKNNGTGDANLCTMISTILQTDIVTNVTDVEAPCIAVIEGDMYLDTLIVGLIYLIGMALAGAFINVIGSKNLLIYGFVIGGVAGICIYWARDKITTLILSAVYITLAGATTTAILGVIVNLFPTSMRTMVISISMMIGRTGSICGNIIFPFLLEAGCLPPFITMGLALIISGLLCIALPKSNKIPLK